MHFTERKESTTLITAYGKNKEKTDNGFITLKDNSALRGLCVFYPDQDCANVVKYSPTVSVVGNNTQINKTTFVGGYINFYVTGENALISYARGLGLNAGFIAEGIDSGRFEYMFFSINDWMKTWDNEVPNAPPEGWHARYPNFENDTFVFENCKNVTLYHSFSYAQGTGLRLEGNIENFATSEAYKRLQVISQQSDDASIIKFLKFDCKNDILLPVEIEKTSLSNGEKQIFIMALYHSLVQLCNREVPFVIDTPFARIDTEHRQNISKHFFSKLNGQVFILSTNEEINTKHVGIMKDKIAVTYMLENTDNTKTSVLQNSYFEE